MKIYRERIQGLALALTGLIFGSMALVYGHWQADDTQIERELCQDVGICASQTLKQAARDQAWSGRPGALQDAIDINREVLAGEPAEPENWASLAEALALAGQDQDAATAYEMAIRLGPNRPDILMRATNWAFETDRIDLATGLVKRLLSLVRNYDQVLFRFLRLAGISPEEALASAIPDEREPLTAYFQTVIRSEGSQAAQIVWNKMAELNLIQIEDAPAYVAKLLTDGRLLEATAAQRKVAGDRDPEWPESNLVFNGGFEHEPLGTVLDWKIQPHHRADISIDREVMAEGEQSLRIHFQGGENLHFANVFQSILLQPSQRYQLSAMVKTEEITTDEGIRMELRRQGNHMPIAVTPSLNRTTDWTRVTLNFRAPIDAGQASLVLLRRRSLRINSKVQGTAWLDTIAIMPVSP